MATQRQSSPADFRKDKFLGKGTYGSVWKVTRVATGKVYALKEVEMSSKKPNERDDAVNEIRILASVKHTNVIRYRDSFCDGSALYIVTDFADLGDLSMIIEQNKKEGTRIPEDQVWTVFLQLALGLEHLHRQSILHRDLKASNVFLMGGCPTVVKIGDLGVAKLLKASSTQTQVGTPFYISPEIWRKLPYNAKSDVWSLGCVLYEMCTLHHPFNASCPKELAAKILKGRYAQIQGYSSDLCSVVDSLLCVETSRRPSMATLLSFPAVRARFGLLPAECVPPEMRTVSAVTHQPEAVMHTIKVPRVLSRLAGVLPPPSYCSPQSTAAEMPQQKKGVDQQSAPDDETLAYVVRRLDLGERSPSAAALPDGDKAAEERRQAVQRIIASKRRRTTMFVLPPAQELSHGVDEHVPSPPSIKVVQLPQQQQPLYPVPKAAPTQISQLRPPSSRLSIAPAARQPPVGSSRGGVPPFAVASPMGPVQAAAPPQPQPRAPPRPSLGLRPSLTPAQLRTQELAQQRKEILQRYSNLRFPFRDVSNHGTPAPAVAIPDQKPTVPPAPVDPPRHRPSLVPPKPAIPHEVFSKPRASFAPFRYK